MSTLIFSETFGVSELFSCFSLFLFHPSAAFLSLSLPLSIFYRSADIFFRGRPRSYVADVFSRFISEILSWSNFHCDLAVRYTFSYTPICISQCHPPSPSLPLPFSLFLFFSPSLSLSFSLSHPLRAPSTSCGSISGGSASRIGRIRRILVQFRIVGLHGSK